MIERRYHAGLKNFLQLYMPVSDDWLVFDNSLNLNIIAQGNSNISIEIYDKLIWTKINEYS